MSHRFSRREFAGLLGAIASPAVAGPQSPGKDQPTFSSDVKVVNVLATVRTKTGDIISDLTKDDFTLSEDGRPQTIKYFSRETNLPLVLGLLVDTSGSQRNVLGEEETASFRFLDKVLREDMDKTFLAHFDFDTELLQDLTSSKDKLRRALAELDMPSQWMRRGAPVGNGGYGGRGRGGRGGQGGGTTLFDAVYLASTEIMSNQEGRKAIILLTDGVDHGSRVSLSDAIEMAQRSDTLIYSILFEGEEGGFSFGRNFESDGRLVLRRMSLETGGGYFEVSKKLKIDAIYTRIEEELRNQYSIGYSPDASPAGKPYRAVSLKTHRRDLVVQARQGYYAGQ